MRCDHKYINDLTQQNTIKPKRNKSETKESKGGEPLHLLVASSVWMSLTKKDRIWNLGCYQNQSIC